jgi:protein involved in polysaccharide export with SLBB domain
MLKAFLPFLSLWMLLSSALAAPPETLLIGPGDQLHIQVVDTPELEQHPRVTDAGEIRSHPCGCGRYDPIPSRRSEIYAAS